MRIDRLIIAASAIAVSYVPSRAAHAQVVTAAGGEVALPQKHVIDRMIVADSVEIEMSLLAAQRTKNAAVLEFANALVADHRQHLDSLRKLAEVPDIGRATMKGDPTRAQDAKAVAQLRVLAADSAFDRAYLAEQIDRHQRAIDNLKKWRESAESVLVHLAIGRALPVVEQHLERAKAVAAQLK